MRSSRSVRRSCDGFQETSAGATSTAEALERHAVSLASRPPRLTALDLGAGPDLGDGLDLGGLDLGDGFDLGGLDGRWPRPGRRPRPGPRPGRRGPVPVATVLPRTGATRGNAGQRGASLPPVTPRDPLRSAVRQGLTRGYRGRACVRGGFTLGGDSWLQTRIRASCHRLPPFCHHGGPWWFARALPRGFARRGGARWRARAMPGGFARSVSGPPQGRGRLWSRVNGGHASRFVCSFMPRPSR